MTYSILSFLLLAVHCLASPIALPQAVTAAIAPSGAPPPGCLGTYPRVFGIVVVNISSSASPESLVRRQTEPSPTASVLTVAEVSQILDGQVQGGMHTVTLAPVTQIPDGQIQNPASTISPVARISTTAVRNPGCHPPPAPGVLDIAETTTRPSNKASAFMPIPTRFSTRTIINTRPATASSSTASRAPPRPKASLVSCITNSTLRLTLSNSNLYDALNRTGYIASNYQFQFDGPPQSGALYTSGWSVCPVVAADVDDPQFSEPAATGLLTLALGNSTTFYSCLSGSFYNLYTENWAAQCNPVELRVVGLVNCAA